MKRNTFPTDSEQLSPYIAVENFRFPFIRMQLREKQEGAYSKFLRSLNFRNKAHNLVCHIIIHTIVGVGKPHGTFILTDLRP